MKSSYRSELTPLLVGDPGFEPGSKRPKRPSIGQTNPYALSLGEAIPHMNFTQGVARFRLVDE